MSRGLKHFVAVSLICAISSTNLVAAPKASRFSKKSLISKCGAAFLTSSLLVSGYSYYNESTKPDSMSISGNSMYPTFTHGGSIDSSRLLDVRSQLPNARTIFKGDVVVLKKWPGFYDKITHVLSGGGSKYAIKRVVAFPGDRVRVSGLDVWVNDVLVERNEAKGASIEYLTSSYDDNTKGKISELIEALKRVDSELIVPKNKVFVLGDNRMMSVDSRLEGPVFLSAIRYKVLSEEYVPYSGYILKENQ